MIEQGSQRQLPMWFIGLFIAGLLIFFSVRGDRELNNPQLEDVFAAQPTPEVAIALPAIAISELPPELQAAASGLWQQLSSGGRVTPLEPRGRGPRIEVAVTAIIRRGDEVRVEGEVTNISTATIEVPISAFELRDSSGIAYSADGGGRAALAPGESTPLELSLPLPEGRGLLLITRFAPDPEVSQILLAREE